MNRLIFDIETIPANKSEKELIEGLAKRKKENAFRNTGLDGNFGRIFCIGYIKEPPISDQSDIIKGNEKDILIEFWKIARDVDIFIGHNVMDFDLKFIYKRSVVHGVKPSRDLNFARYRSEPIYDTMREWENWSMGSATSLDTLAKIFGFKTSKDDMCGSEVYDKYLEKKYDEIYKYCKKDVELTRKIYYKMNFLPL